MSRSREPSLQRYVGLSAIVHAVLLIILIVTPALGPSKRPFKREQIVWVRIPKGLGDKIGVGMKKAKGLPKTTIEEAKKPLSVPPPSKEKERMTLKEAPKELPPMGPTKPAPKKKKPKPAYKSAVDKALARISKEAHTKVPEAAQIPEELEEGGVPFGSETGPFVSPDDPIYVLYQAKIRQRILDAWVLPMSFVGRDISYLCRIVVRIDETGKVIRAEFEQRSGNDAFDESAFRAIFRASPLDIPPEKLKREAIEEGFLVEFSPEMKS